MNTLRYFIDEDVYATIAISLRKSGLDALSTPEAGRRGESDESQLAFATSTGRALVSFNVAHFAALHAGWLSCGRDHAGIVVSNQRAIGDTLRRLIHLARTVDAGDLKNRLEYLGDW
jgi:Domain of unknown function (DUF5615)